MRPSPGHHLLSLHRRVGIVLQRTKQLKFFLSQNKFIETWQRQSPRIFNWLTNIFRVKMRRSSKPVVFNLFHAATNFATQFNLTTPFRKFPVRHIRQKVVP